MFDHNNRRRAINENPLHQFRQTAQKRYRVLKSPQFLLYPWVRVCQSDSRCMMYLAYMREMTRFDWRSKRVKRTFYLPQALAVIKNGDPVLDHPANITRFV